MKRRTASVLAISLTTSVFLLLGGCNAGAPSGSGGGQDAANEAEGPGGGQTAPEEGDTEINAAKDSVVTLSPRGGSDSFGGDVSCRWEQIAGPVKLELDEATVSSCEPRIRPTVEGVYLFELTTTDSSGRSETETVLLRVGENEFPTGAPIAIAGDDQTVGEGSPVTLDGGRSRDPDGDTLIFIWRQVRGVEAALSGNTVADPTFVAPFVEREAELVFELAVSDGALGSTDTCSVTVLDRGDDGECQTNADCDDGRFCNGQEQCVGGVCQNGLAPCTAGTEECDEVTDACLAVPVPPDGDGGDQLECETDDDCNDGLFCNGVEACVAGLCVAGDGPCGEGLVCDEENDWCAAATGCEADGDCDDGLFCNGTESCDENGECLAGTSPCGPGSVCDEEDDLCVAAAECASDADCPDDGLFCNGTESCDLTANPPVCVSSGDPCGAGETCDEDADTCVIPECQADGDCDDGLYCNGTETCDGTGLCQAGTPPCDPETETCSEGAGTAICTPISGGTIDFTLGADDLTGTAGDDTFSAPLIFNPGSGTNVASLQTGDQANGLGGIDLLEAFFNGGNATPSSLAGIETFNLTAITATTLNATNITDVTTINSVNSVATMTASNLGFIVDAEITDTNAGLVLAFTSGATSGTADTMNWTISGANGGHAVVETAGASGFETINMISTGGTANTLASLTHDGASLETLNFTGSQDLTVSALPGTLTTVNASSFAASLTADASGSSVWMTITGGLGDDTLLSGSGRDTISGGAGNDSITAGTGGDWVSGGTGADRFVFTSGSLVVSPDIINDFGVGVDKLQFAGIDDVASGQPVAVQQAVDLAVSSPPAILAAMAEANETNLGVAVGEKDGHTYVLFELTGAGGFETDTDVFIRLDGVDGGFTFVGDVID